MCEPGTQTPNRYWVARVLGPTSTQLHKHPALQARHLYKLASSTSSSALRARQLLSALQAPSSASSPALHARQLCKLLSALRALSSPRASWRRLEVVVIPHHFPTARRLLGQKTLRGFGCAQRRASLSRGAWASSVRARARGPAWFSIFIACVRFAHTTEVLLAASCNGPPQPRRTAGTEISSLSWTGVVPGQGLPKFRVTPRQRPRLPDTSPNPQGHRVRPALGPSWGRMGRASGSAQTTCASSGGQSRSISSGGNGSRIRSWGPKWISGTKN